MDLLGKISKDLSKTQTTTVSTKYFFINKGGVVFGNLYIPMDAVSVVKLKQIEDVPLKPYIIALLVGLGVCLFALPVGIIITVVSAVLLFITWKNNQHKEYRLLLKLNNGDVYNLTYGDLDDIIEVVESIRLIVEEKFDGNLLINNSNTININDNSVGKVCGNIFKGDTDDMQQFTNSKNPMDSQLHTSNITEEWVELTKYFGDKQFSSDDKDIKYQAKYEMAEQMAKKKNMAGLRAIIGKASSEFAKILCSEGAKIGIKAILDKVIV